MTCQVPGLLNITSAGNISKAGWRYCMSSSCFRAVVLTILSCSWRRVVGMATLPADPWVANAMSKAMNIPRLLVEQ